ncbi:MAG: TIGR04283 family arsenosugar biosynthesis glycosyltransferase [Planctomycetaceae bacterium]|jgi:rSAM/selenodomain-associated transferase 2|nr:TIGR04283 family arsenosugar biosynthesis glycosyltransferase [Planctomycetaceae bacterium]
MARSLSIIIPVAKEDSVWRELLWELVPMRNEAEIVIAATEYQPEDWISLQQSWGFDALDSPVRWLKCPAGRASQMNEAARQAAGGYLWFLHADSRLAEDSISALMASLGRHPDDLHYFDLEFQSDAPVMMRLNAWGVWFRSHIFNMPFGDQGLAISKINFDQLGGYDETLPYGEDHHLVWTARIAGLKLRAVKATLSTSARKYQQRGWWRTTYTHVWLTWKQAIPMYCRLLKRRWFS